MSSRFVSAGAIDPVTGEAASDTATNSSAPPADPKTDEWLVVQKELDAERRRREEHKASAAAAGEEKSLYEVLEANKAAKQAAFEEANKIKNQFRALDDDEIDFLDDVAARKRAEEDRVRRETEEGLRAFRAARNGGGGGAKDEDEDEDEAGEEAEWAAAGAAGRKRKRREKLVRVGLRGAVKRKVSDGREVGEEGKKGGIGDGADKETAQEVRTPETATAEPSRKSSVGSKPKPSPPPVSVAQKPKLGLVDYGSDDEDD